MKPAMGIIVVLGVVAVIGVGYYGLSPLWHPLRADESLPITSKESDIQTSGIPVSSAQEEGRVSTGSPVTGTVGHPASGAVKIIEAGGKKYLRYENFHTINGPDIYVYLSKDLNAKEFVNLGKVRATEGNINYEVPPNIDLSEYRYVLTWCKQFGVLFNYADLSRT